MDAKGGKDASVRRTMTMVGQRYHAKDTGRARKWNQGNQASFAKLGSRDAARRSALAEARALMPPRVTETVGDDLATRLLALRDRLTVLYSFERCPDCRHLGWAHARCGDCGCERKWIMAGATA